MPSPLFILGCPRSGTTLLARLLGPTSYGSPVESHFITKYYKKLSKYGDLSHKENFADLVKDIFKERPVMQWDLNIDPYELFDQMNSYNFNTIVHKICMLRAEKNHTPSWGDKTPHYILDIDVLYELFPGAKFIYLVRDGRDVALSLLEKPWGPNNIYACAVYWNKCYAQSSILENLQTQQNLFSLRYEDLLSDPSKYMKEIYCFLGEEDNINAMEKLLPQVNDSNFNKWKHKMNPSQIKVFERIASKSLARFGYETNHLIEEESKFIDEVFKVHDTLTRWSFILKQNTVDAIKIKYFGKAPFAE